MGKQGKHRPKSNNRNYNTEAFFFTMLPHSGDCLCSSCCRDSWAGIPMEKVKWGYPDSKFDFEKFKSHFDHVPDESTTWPDVATGVAESFQWSDNVARYETKPQKLSTSTEDCSILFASRIMAIGIVLFVWLGLRWALRRVK